MQILDKTLPGLTRFETAGVVAFFSDMTCGENCWKAKEETCRCECGGKNHGIQLRGGSGVRACKINGYRYELLAIGKQKDLLEQTEQLCRDAAVRNGSMQLRDGEYWAKSYQNRPDLWFKSKYIHPSEYNRGGGDYVLKLASLSQCLKWSELEYLQIADDRDRYFAQPVILWKRCDVPSYL